MVSQRFIGGIDTKRTFGCEFEFSKPECANAPEALKEAFGSVSSVPSSLSKAHNTFYRAGRTWILKHDGSTEGELCTPILHYKDLPHLCRIVRALHKAGFRATHADGFHVHVGCKNVDHQVLLAMWTASEPSIMKCFPEHRRHNDFCSALVELRSRSGPHSEVVAVYLKDAEDYSNSHHSVLSFSERYPTVEFRLAEGTFDPVLARHWIKFCLAFVNYATTGKVNVFDLLCGDDVWCKPTMQDVCKLVHPGPWTSKYFEEREERFR